MRRELFAAGCCAALAVAALGDGLGGRDKARPSQRTPVKHVVLIGVDGLDVAPTVAGLLGLKPPDFWRGRFAMCRSACGKVGRCMWRCLIGRL